MKKIFTILCLSMIYQTIQAQKLPWIVPPNLLYKHVEPFSEGLSVIQKGKKEAVQYHFIDKEGNLSDDNYAMAYSVSNGYACVLQKNGFWAFRKGKNKFLGGEYEAALDFKNGMAAVKKEGKWGFISHTGAFQIPCKYDGVRYFSDNWVGGKKGDKVMIINTLGSEKYVPYVFVNAFSEGLAAVETQNGDKAYIDTLGNEVIAVRKGRKYASSFFEGFAAISDTLPHLAFINREGKTAFWFKNGTLEGGKEGKDAKLDQSIHDLHPFSEGLAAVKQRGKWGFIDTTGVMTIPYQYDAVTRFSENVAAVRQGSRWFYIDKKGNVKRAGDFLDAKSCTEGVAWVKTKEGWGLLAMTEKLEIVVTAPSLMSSKFETSTTLEARISSHCPLKIIQIEWNGERIQHKILKNLNTLEMEIHQPIVLKTGKNVLKIMVKNNLSDTLLNRAMSELVFHYQPDSVTPIRYKALMIANNQYQDDYWANLNEKPIADADHFASILHEKYQFNQIVTLRNATLAQMKATLKDLADSQDPNQVEKERILIFYAGHGDQDKNLKTAYLVPTDAQGLDKKRQLSATTFAHYLNRMDTKHILFIIDACYGGSFILDAPLAQEREERGGGVQQKPKTNTSNTEKDPAEQLKSRRVMSSGHRIEVPNTSIFIQYLFENLRNNSLPKLSAGTLFHLLEAPVMEKSQLVPQFGFMPQAGHEGGDFIFRKKI